MIILRIACDNIYMFQKFNLDLTYNRRINHPLAQNDLLFPNSRIKVRKNLVIMGANASGKTTFGKLLRFVLNYINGKSFEHAPDDVIAGIQCNKKKPATFEIEFVIDHIAYLLKAEFDNQRLIHEELLYCGINTSDNITALREKLASRRIDPGHNITPEKTRTGLASVLFSSNPTETTDFIKRHISYSFRISLFRSNSIDYPISPNIERINRILPRIDNSVKQVEGLLGSKDKTKTNSYLIKFTNGDLLTVPDGDLRHCGERLSHGTFESINFISLLDDLQSEDYNGVFYVDEQLSHIHSELEAYLIRQAFLQKKDTNQLFFTTHNIEILDLNIPVNSFIFFHRDKKGWNEAIFPSNRLNKNDRSLRGYYENDYFGILPDYSILDKFFESNNKEAQKND